MWRILSLLLLFTCTVVGFRCASPSGQEQPPSEVSSSLEQGGAEGSLDAEARQEPSPEKPTSEPESLPDASVKPDSSVTPEPSIDSSVTEFPPEPARETTPPDTVTQDMVLSEGTTQTEQQTKSCTFNADCPTAERCECDESTGCFCQPGQRGTGKNGVDVCKTGNDCETSLCNEGSDGNFYCSGPCNQDSDCAAKLPLCANISFVGKICIRQKP